MKFKPGDKTNRIYRGDIAREHEFIGETTKGRLIFYDTDGKYFVAAYWKYDSRDGKFYLYAWDDAANSIYELLNKSEKMF